MNKKCPTFRWIRNTLPVHSTIRPIVPLVYQWQIRVDNTPVLTLHGEESLHRNPSRWDHETGCKRCVAWRRIDENRVHDETTRCDVTRIQAPVAVQFDEIGEIWNEV